ncbi:hypothetical protein ACROYT_G040134 [Oculina patagonica]
MSMKNWRTLAKKKAAVERQNAEILTAMKNKAIAKKFGQLSGEEVFKPLTRRFDRAFTAQKKTDAEEGPNYTMDDFDIINPFDGAFMPDAETPPVTPPSTPDAETPSATPPRLPVPDYSIAESDQDFEDDTPESTPPPTPTSSPVPTLAEGESDDDDDDETKDDDDETKDDDDEATLSHDLSQSVERGKWETPQKPEIKGSESTDLQVLNSMLTKNKDNPDYVVKSLKSKFYDPSKRYKAALNELVTMSYSWFNVSEKYDNNKVKWKKKSDSNWITVTIPDGMYDYQDLNNALQASTDTLFFEELSDKLLPPMQLEFEIDLNPDAELIWDYNATTRRIVVRTLELWVPMLRFTSEGQTLANEDFLKPRTWTHISEMVMPSPSRRDAFGTWQISPGIKDAKHIFIFIQQSQRVDTFTQNPYFFDTFNIDGDGSAKLATCRLQYGASQFYPELEYDENFKLRILNDVMNYRYRKNDYNTGVQLQTSNFSTLYPFLYFDLRENKDNVTNDPKQLIFYYRLNEAADVDYTIFAGILYENEMVLKQLGNELVVV